MNSDIIYSVRCLTPGSLAAAANLGGGDLHAIGPGVPTTSRVQGDLLNTDLLTAQTVALMCGHIKKSARNPDVIRLAFDITRGTTMRGNDRTRVWRWVNHNLTFVHHDRLIWEMFGERDQAQLLISPERLLQMRPMMGDCAIYTMMVCALLECLNLPWQIVTVAVDRQRPGEFSHVYAQSGGMILDASHGDYPGWEVPARDIQRKQVWNSDARPSWGGLHAYGLAGCDPNYLATTGQCIPDGTSSPTSGGSTWTNLIQDLTRQWSELGTRVIAADAGVQQSVYTPGIRTGSAFQFLTSPQVGTGIPGWVWIAGGVLVAVVLLKKK